MAASSDVEEREMAEAELPSRKAHREEMWNELLDMTVGGEDANRTRCVMEIRAGTGGDEAALFARNLFEMYKKHAEARRWKVEILNANPTELGGFKEITLALFEGDGVFRELQYESGGHRVQRVPETEAKGRIHTSAATVAVLPEPEDVEIDIKPDDYRKDIFPCQWPRRATREQDGIRRATDALRIRASSFPCRTRRVSTRTWRKPCGCSNRDCMICHQQQEHEKRASERKSLVGSGDRSQRIRTYNFPENRVTDHRINLTLYKLDQIIGGLLEPISQALIDHDRDEMRRGMEDLD